MFSLLADAIQVAPVTAPPANELQYMSVILQGGSFGVLVIIIFYVGKVLVPKVITIYEKQGEECRKERDALIARQDSQLQRRDSAFETTFGRVTEAINKLADKVERLEDTHIRQMERRHGADPTFPGPERRA